jgi:hypothetical protein
MGRDKRGVPYYLIGGSAPDRFTIAPGLKHRPSPWGGPNDPVAQQSFVSGKHLITGVHALIVDDLLDAEENHPP